jgi:hypothetical protein
MQMHRSKLPERPHPYGLKSALAARHDFLRENLKALRDARPFVRWLLSGWIFASLPTSRIKGLCNGPTWSLDPLVGGGGRDTKCR